MSKYKIAHEIQVKRTKALEVPLKKKLKGERIEKLSNQQLLEKVINLTNFPLDRNVRLWILESCKGKEEIIYVFQLLFQRALNAGRDYLSMEEFNHIKKNINFSVLHQPTTHLIGTTYTIGKLEGKLQKITVKCCAVPTKERQGRIICPEELTINYLFAKKMIKNYNIYVEISPSKPKDDDGWEVALAVAIYSAIYNKVLPIGSVVLGGIDKKGNIIPSKEDRLEKAIQEKFLYIFTGYRKYKNDDLQSYKLYNMIYVHTLEEIISRTQQHTKSKEFKDFLCL